MKDSSHFAVGRSLPRIDAIEKAMGEARYNNDETQLDTLALAIVGSPRPHLQLRNLDVSSCLQTPGVLKVLTAHDIPGLNRLPWGEQPFLVEGEACFAGEPVALVLAEQRSDAIEGARRVHIEYEELPALTDLDSARDADAPTRITLLKGHNIWARHEREQGDVDAAFSQSEQVIQQTYTTSAQSAGSIEPPGVTARPSSDGGIHIEGSIQAPFAVQAAVSNMLQLPYHRVYVKQRTLGGDTGSKGETASLFAAYAALGAWLTGRPTRLSLSSEEELRLAGCRPPTEIHYKYGASREGDIQACEVHITVQCGAYAGLVDMALARALAHATGPYAIPNIRVVAEAVATHTTPFGLLMGYGQLPVTFAQESLIDELAFRINLDPIELRRRNLLHPSSPLPWQDVPDPSSHIHEALDTVLTLSNWENRTQDEEQKDEKEPQKEAHSLNGELYASRKKCRGMGIALTYTGLSTGFEDPSTPPQANVTVRLQRDGSVQVSVPVAKKGTGTRTLLAQIVAESLSVPYHAVHLLEAGTLHCSNGALHTLHAPLLLTGMALLDATLPLQRSLLEVAAEHFGCEVTALSTSPGMIHGPEENQTFSFAEAVQRSIQLGRPTSRSGFVAHPLSKPNNPSYPAYAYAAQVAEVEIDLETYEVSIVHFYTVCDQGTRIHPAQAQTEIEGQIFLGLGFTLLEELANQDGVPINGPMLAYSIPEFKDAPTLHTHFLDHSYTQGPYGSKGFGSIAALGAPPAIINAIADALGRRIYSLPVTPENLFSTTSSQS